MSLVLRPVKLLLSPSKIEAHYQRSLKLQLALFRSSFDERGKRTVKMDKTPPMRFTHPHQPILLNNVLTLLTTLYCDPLGRDYQDKEVEFQMALEVDGCKARLNRKINLREVIGPSKQHSFSLKDPLVVIYFVLELKIEGEKLLQRPLEKPVDKYISKEKSKNILKTGQLNSKRIKFEDNTTARLPSSRAKQSDPTNVGAQQSKENHRSAVTTFSSSKQISEQPEKEGSRLKKAKSMARNSYFKQQEENAQSEFANLSYEGHHFDEAKSKYSSLIINYRQLENKIEERDIKIVELARKISDLEELLKLTQIKNEKILKDVYIKEETIKLNYQNQLTSQREEIKTLQRQIEHLSNKTQNYEQSYKHIAEGNQAETCRLKQQIAHLKEQNSKLSQQRKQLEAGIQSKEQIVRELKAKNFNMERENSQLKQKIKGVQQRSQKNIKEFQQEVVELKDQIEEIKNQNKQLKMPSNKHLTENWGQMKKKIEHLTKMLQKKENLFKKMTQMHQEIDLERNLENQSLRRELCKLKDELSKINEKSSASFSSTQIQWRVQVQKMKKQLQSARRLQTQLLIQKNRLENTANEMEDEVIKAKQRIAFMVNAVQQRGDEQLINQIFSCME